MNKKTWRRHIHKLFTLKAYMQNNPFSNPDRVSSYLGKIGLGSERLQDREHAVEKLDTVIFLSWPHIGPY